MKPREKNEMMFTHYFKRQLLESINEEFPATRINADIQLLGPEASPMEKAANVNLLYKKIYDAIFNEDFDLDFVTKDIMINIGDDLPEHYNLSWIPKPRFLLGNARTIRVLSVKDGRIVSLITKNHKAFPSEIHPSIERSEIVKVEDYLKEGGTVRALVFSRNWKMVVGFKYMLDVVNDGSYDEYIESLY